MLHEKEESKIIGLPRTALDSSKACHHFIYSSLQQNISELIKVEYSNNYNISNILIIQKSVEVLRGYTA